MLLHLRDAFEGLEGADQDTAADSRDFRADVEHEMVAVAEVDVSVAAPKEHGAIARSGSAEVMSGGIALRVGLGFDDPTAELSASEFPHDNLTDEEAGEGDGVRGELGAAEAPDGNGSFGSCQVRFLR
jgi:hypothetical protein